MDVSFNNVLESTRQYFQGVPPAAVGTGGTPQYNSIANLAGTGGPQSLPAGTTAPSYYQPPQQVSYQNSQQQNYPSAKQQEYQHQDSLRVPSLAPFSTLNFRTNSKSSTPPRHDYPQYQVLRTPQQQQQHQLHQEQQNHHLEQSRHHDQQRHLQEQQRHQEQQRQHQEQQRQHQEQQRQHQEHQRYQQERQHQEQQRYQQEQRLQEHQRQEEQRHQERMQEQQRHHQELQRHNQEQQRIHHEQQRQEHQRLQYQEQQRQRELLRVPQPQEPRPPSQQSLPIRTPTPSQQIKPQLNGNASPGVRSSGSRTPVNYLGYNYHQQIQKPVPPSTSSQYEHPEPPPRDLTTPHGYYPNQANQTTPNQVQNHQQQRVQSSIQKRESPLDLSVKTVRQSADSTASDSEQANYYYLQQEYMKNKQQQYMQSYHYQMQNPQYQQPSTAKVEYPAYSDKNQLPQQHDPKRKKENPQMQYYQALPSMGSFAKHYYPNVPPQGKQAQPRPPYPAEHYARQQYPPNYLKRPAHEEVKQSGSSQSSAPVSKQPRVDAWRQSIDQQIEKRFNSYLSSQGVNGDSKKGGYANQPPNFYPDQKQPNGGAADKRVLSILRNSLETKEARNMQQIQQSKQMQYQQMQQKSRGMQPGYQARHNLPPFCAIERATPPQPSPYLQHFPPMPHGYAKPTYPHKEGEAVVDITSDDELRPHNTQGKGEYDGLAAFLAARIRTKAELKQQPNSANIAPGSSNYNPHATPAFQSSKDLVKSNSVADLLTNTAKGWTYPQKYAKEQAIAANLPRKRLSKPEDGAANFVQMTESSTTTENSPFPIPPRDSGLRSSSEASVFDFRDSDSETDLPVLERQSLNEMRRVGIKREEDPEHEEEYKSWLENCEELVLQLQLGKAYRRKHKKKSRKHILPFVCDIKKEPDADFSLQNDTKLEVKIKSEPLSGDEKVKQEKTSEARIFCEPLGTVKKKRGPQNRVKPVVAKKRTKKIKLEFAPIWHEDVSTFKNSLRTSNEISTRIKPPCCPKGSLSLPNLDSFPDIPTSGSNIQNGHSPDKKSITKSLAEEKSFLDRLMQRYLSRKSKNPKMADKGMKPSQGLESESGFCGFEKEDENHFINIRNDYINSRVSLITNEAFYHERPASAPPPGTTRENLAKLRCRKPEIKKELSHIKKATLLKARLLGKMQEGKKMKTKVKMFRRKLKSSGFDYIRKKKKAPGPKKEGEQPKERKKKTPPMTEQEIQNEIKGWVLNKGLGETILHRASKLGNVETVRYILDKMNHNPAPRDNAGYTPLHEACSRGHVQIVNLLLTYGADVSDSALGGIRPLHEAAENNCIKVVKLLLDHGADPLLATYAGNTALSLATDEEARQLMELHVANCNTPPPSVIKSEDSPCGSQVGESIKQEEPVRDQLENFEIEESEVILPNLYRLANESRAESWVLFHDLAPLLNVKTKEALLKQLGQSSGQVLRDLKLSDFLAKAHCRTLKSSTTTAIPTTPRVTLVKYTDTVKFLLGVETSIVPR